MTILINNISGPGADVDSVPARLKGGSAIVFVRGDVLDGATVLIEAASSNDTLNRYEVLENGTFVGNGTIKIDYTSTVLIVRARVIDRGTLSSNIYVELVQ